MEEMPKHPRLARRGSVFYLRAPIPADIKATYPKVEETKSLGTSDPNEALRLLRKESAAVDEKFEAHRRELACPAEPEIEVLTADQIKHVGKLDTSKYRRFRGVEASWRMFAAC